MFEVQRGIIVSKKKKESKKRRRRKIKEKSAFPLLKFFVQK